MSTAAIHNVRFTSIVLKNPQNALAPNSRICAATLGINADYALKAPRKATEGEGRLLAGSPSNFRRSLCAVTGIVIDRKIRVFQHRVMGGSSSTQADTIGQDVEEETVQWTILLASISRWTRRDACLRSRPRRRCGSREQDGV